MVEECIKGETNAQVGKGGHMLLHKILVDQNSDGTLRRIPDIEGPDLTDGGSGEEDGGWTGYEEEGGWGIGEREHEGFIPKTVRGARSHMLDRGPLLGHRKEIVNWIKNLPINDEAMEDWSNLCSLNITDCRSLRTRIYEDKNMETEEIILARKVASLHRGPA